MVLMNLSIIQEETTGNHRDNSSLSQSLLTHHFHKVRVNTVKVVKVVSMVVHTVVHTVKVATTGQKTPNLSGCSQFDFSTSIEQS